MLLPVRLDIARLSMGCETIGGVATKPTEHNITVTFTTYAVSQPGVLMRERECMTMEFHGN